MKVEYLELSKIKKTELLNFMKGTKNKEEYRRASAVKQKLEGLPYSSFLSNLPVNNKSLRSIKRNINRYIDMF